MQSAKWKMESGSDFARRERADARDDSAFSTLHFHFALLLTLCLPLAAFADAGYVSVPDLARQYGLQYKDMSDGVVHAGKLTGKDIKVLLFADVRSIT